MRSLRESMCSQEAGGPKLNNLIFENNVSEKMERLLEHEIAESPSLFS